MNLTLLTKIVHLLKTSNVDSITFSIDRTNENIIIMPKCYSDETVRLYRNSISLNLEQLTDLRIDDEYEFLKREMNRMVGEINDKLEEDKEEMEKEK